jgi:hypothetical protein
MADGLEVMYLTLLYHVDISGDVPYNSEAPSSPLTRINADNLTEGNETLTLSWYIFGEVVASTSITIVDTSTGP